MNVKPGRIGGLRPLFEVYARCERERRPMYGGGFGELGAGRGQIQLLAALFHADAPNDVAPSAYNEDDPPGSLPGSPLPPRPRQPASAGGADAPQRRGVEPLARGRQAGRVELPANTRIRKTISATPIATGTITSNAVAAFHNAGPAGASVSCGRSSGTPPSVYVRAFAPPD